MHCRHFCSHAGAAGLDLISTVVQHTPLHQGDELIRDPWTSQHFQLTSEAVQAKLRKYLQIPQILNKMPEDVRHSATPAAEQLGWLTDLAVTEFSGWVDSFLNDLKHHNITLNHLQANTAAELVTAFRCSAGNAIAAWCDASSSAENLKILLRHLQLTPVQCSSANAAIAHSILQAPRAEPVDTGSELYASKLAELNQVMSLQLC